MKTLIGLVDDHQLFLKSLSMMLESFGKFTVVVEASDGKDLQKKLENEKALPEIMLIDVNMPVMDGVETATSLFKKYPSIKLVALTMDDNDQSIIKMFKAGCCAYLLKDVHPNELEKALIQVKEKGFYNADARMCISGIYYCIPILNMQKLNLHPGNRSFSNLPAAI